MNIMLTPDLENSVLRSCSDLIATNDFYLEKRSAYEVYLLSEKCGIRIMAGISPIGEEQIEFDFFDPRIKDNRRKYYSHTFLLYPISTEKRKGMCTFGEEKAIKLGLPVEQHRF